MVNTHGNVRAALFCFWIVFGVHANTGVLAAQDEPGGVLVDALLQEIRDTLIRVRNGATDQIRLKKANLSLKTVFTKSASGKLDLWVLNFGAETKHGTTQQIDIALRPPSGGDQLKASATSDALADAILVAYAAVRKAGRSNPPLRLVEMTASIRFLVEQEGTGGFKFTILPVTAQIAGEVSSSHLQELSLTFCDRDCG